MDTTLLVEERPAVVMPLVTPAPASCLLGWQMLEPAYHARQFENWQHVRERAIQEKRQELETLGPRATKHREQLETVIRIWEQQLVEAQTGIPPSARQQFHDQYLEVVRRALKSGQPVPPEVIAQYPEFVTARDNRARYEKGRHTSFANRSAAVDDTMLEVRGFKIKRQDGKAMTPEICADILRGMDDIESVLGPLADLARASNLTISHTNGRHPFCNKAVGLYSVDEGTITMGHWIPSLGHEIGHWLDHQCGHAYGLKSTVVVGKRKYKQVPAWSEHAAYAPHEPMQIRLCQAYQWAAARLNNYLEIPRLLKMPYTNLNEEDRRHVERIKIQLGPYYSRMREVWARLFEMYLAARLGRPSPAIETSYFTLTGYWNETTWAHLEPMVDDVVHYLLAAWRAKLAETPPSA